MSRRRQQDGPGRQFVAIDVFCKCPRPKRLFRVGRDNFPGADPTPWVKSASVHGTHVLPEGWDAGTKAIFACVHCGVDAQYRYERIAEWLEKLIAVTDPGTRRVERLEL